MYYKEICRYSFYFLHMSFIFSSFIGIFFTWKIMILQGVTIISWKINNNNCILTQMEDYFFEESIIDLYFNYINKERKHKNYIVPYGNRISLYILFLLELFYYFN
jgi:hypothetical protein